MSPAEEHLGKPRVYRWRIYLRGTHPKDGVDFTATDYNTAVLRAASAFGCSTDDLLCSAHYSK